MAAGQTGTTEGHCVQTCPPSSGQAMKTEGHYAETHFPASDQATILFVRTAALLLVWDGDPLDFMAMARSDFNSSNSLAVVAIASVQLQCQTN